MELYFNLVSPPTHPSPRLNYFFEIGGVCDNMSIVLFTLVSFCHRQKFPEITTRYYGETQRVFRQADELDRGGKHTGNAETLVDIEMGIGFQSVAAN